MSITITITLPDTDTLAPLYAALAAGARVVPQLSVEEDDDEPDDMGCAGSLWVVSTHRLMCAGIALAEWTRCARGCYGGNGGPGTSPDCWEVEEDTEGGDVLPADVAAILEVSGLTDGAPDVPEPDAEEPDQAVDGEYAVYWATVGDDAHVVGRYADERAARSVAERMQRELRARHPGQLLCGYEVRVLDGDEWVEESAQ